MQPGLQRKSRKKRIGASEELAGRNFAKQNRCSPCNLERKARFLRAPARKNAHIKIFF
jgi:hypothetical protein